MQQLDSAGETIMYTVVYYGQHTCKTNMSNAPLHVVETSTPQSISTTCCSDDLGDYSQKMENMHTPELAEVCSDELGSYHAIIGAEHSALGLEDEHMHKLLDTFACGALDLDSWEIDAIVRSGFC